MSYNLYVIVISLSDLLQKMLVLSLHVIICLPNSLQQIKENLLGYSIRYVVESYEKWQNIDLYLRQIGLGFFMFGFQIIRKSSFFPATAVEKLSEYSENKTFSRQIMWLLNLFQSAIIYNSSKGRAYLNTSCYKIYEFDHYTLNSP